MPAHWKHRATRCAVVSCERTRRKGWSTCPQHYPLIQHAPSSITVSGYRITVDRIEA